MVDRDRFREEVFVGSLDEATFVNSLLQGQGIASEVEIPHQTVSDRLRRFQSVYVLNEVQASKAREIVARYKAGDPLVSPKTYRSWRCRSCNELIEGQFSECWNCGASREPLS